MHPGVFVAILGIALLDMVLSGDNALVIGAAAAKLPYRQRQWAIIWGGVGAVLLRLLLATGAVELLTVPLLRAVGALVIFVIAIRLLLPEHEQSRGRGSPERLWAAIITITAADVTMSLDNVIAVAAIANGNIVVLAIGIAFSMILLFVASAIIARLMSYFTWLLDLAAVVLAWTAVNLVFQDPIVSQWLPQQENAELVSHLGLIAVVLVVDLFARAFRARHEAEVVRARALEQTHADDALQSAAPGVRSRQHE
jgi:YjbE family integral membrane protein